MYKISHLIVLALFLFGTSSAFAQGRVCNLGTLIGGIALNTGTASDLIFTLGAVETCEGTSRTQRVANSTYLVLIFDYTYSAGTPLIATHTVGFTSTADVTPGECSSTSGGTCTSGGTGVTSMAVSGDIKRSHRYKIRGYPFHKIVMSEAGSDGSDVITVTGYLVD